MSFLAAILVTSMVLTAPAATAPGGLVAASGGNALTFRAADSASAVAIQNDGKIVAAGTAGPVGGPYDFALARYSADGSLDRTFGPGGKVQTGFNELAAVAYAVAVQSDGEIVAAGASREDFALARYNPNGSLDPSFGRGGRVRTDLGERSSGLSGVATQGDGKIVVAGRSGLDFVLARYNADGSLDASFGPGGKVVTGFGTDRRTEASAVALQGDGKIVAAGWSRDADDGGQPLLTLARYNADGSLDPSFGAGGKVQSDGFVLARAVAIQADGRIVAAGASLDSNFALARFNADGSLDPSFGSDGKVQTEFGGYDAATAVAIQADGRIVAAGGSAPGDATSAFALARYNTDGRLDPSFGSGGMVRTRFGRSNFASAVAIQHDGRIVAAGESSSAAGRFANRPSDFALARYSADGRLDSSFGSGGKVRTDFARVVSLSATKSRRGVRLRWRTASEHGTRGFNIYRGSGRRLNGKLLPIKGDATHGASYSFLDSKALRGRVLKYRLDELRRDAPRVSYGPVMVKRSRP